MVSSGKAAVGLLFWTIKRSSEWCLTTLELITAITPMYYPCILGITSDSNLALQLNWSFAASIPPRPFHLVYIATDYSVLHRINVVDDFKHLEITPLAIAAPHLSHFCNNIGHQQAIKSTLAASCIRHVGHDSKPLQIMPWPFAASHFSHCTDDVSHPKTCCSRTAVPPRRQRGILHHRLNKWLKLHSVTTVRVGLTTCADASYTFCTIIGLQ